MFQSVEAKALDVVFREVGILSNQLGMTLVNTRQKLQPFIDEGVVHQDRKRRKKDKKSEEIKIERKIDCTLHSEVAEYRAKIKDLMERRHVHELSHLLDQLIQKLDDSKYSDELYTMLRMDIIHGQICMAKYFNWKQELTLKRSAEGNTLFKEAVKNSEHAEKVKDMLKHLPDRQKSSHGRPASRASSNGMRSGYYRATSQISKSSDSSYGSLFLGGGGQKVKYLDKKRDSYMTSPQQS